MLEEIKHQFTLHVKSLQEDIIEKMQSLDADVKLIRDEWVKDDFMGAPGGGGLTCALSGNLFENAGVNTSLVYGQMNPEYAAHMSKRAGTQASSDLSHMWATGISLIIHPLSPRIPTVHANFRMLEVGGRVWFGGGADLTPFYPYEEDFHYFHSVWQKALAASNQYVAMKKQCDEYFVNLHRQREMRGVGGIFFDYLNTGDLKADAEFVKNLSHHFISSYFPIVEKRREEKWNPMDEDFQLHRRGRYVEFNLLHDRGTQFGLKTQGRTDSILISLPARCKFGYKYSPPPLSPQAKMMSYYYPQDWANWSR